MEGYGTADKSLHVLYSHILYKSVDRKITLCPWMQLNSCKKNHALGLVVYHQKQLWYPVKLFTSKPPIAIRNIKKWKSVLKNKYLQGQSSRNNRKETTSTTNNGWGWRLCRSYRNINNENPESHYREDTNTRQVDINKKDSFFLNVLIRNLAFQSLQGNNFLLFLFF